MNIYVQLSKMLVRRLMTWAIEERDATREMKNDEEENINEKKMEERKNDDEINTYAENSEVKTEEKDDTEEDNPTDGDYDEKEEKKNPRHYLGAEKQTFSSKCTASPKKSMCNIAFSRHMIWILIKDARYVHSRDPGCLTTGHNVSHVPGCNNVGLESMCGYTTISGLLCI